MPRTDSCSILVKETEKKKKLYKKEIKSINHTPTKTNHGAFQIVKTDSKQLTFLCACPTQTSADAKTCLNLECNLPPIQINDLIALLFSQMLSLRSHYRRHISDCFTADNKDKKGFVHLAEI